MRVDLSVRLPVNIRLLVVKFGGSQKLFVALAGVTQCIGRWPANRGVAGSIPSQGTCLGCVPGPHWGACERQPIDVPLAH